MMIYCNYCGHSLTDDSVFCNHCGRKIPLIPKTEIEKKEVYKRYNPNITWDMVGKQTTTVSPPKHNASFSEVWENIKALLGILFLLGIIALIIWTATTDDESENKSTNDYSTTISLPTTVAHTPNDEDAGLTAQPLPATGKVFLYTTAERDSELTIKSSSRESYVIKMKNTSGQTVFSFFVRAGDTITMSVPSGKYYVYFACGDTWYGTNDLFGSSTSYSMDDEIKDFTNYTYEYTLYPVSNGNFVETPIDASDF